jgi:phosphotransferase system  glucose/maltose/N-acetylglucosamine-specific IIC component
VNFQKWISGLLAWLQTADRANAIAVVICGVVLAFVVALTIHWAKARYRAANIAARNSQRIAARHYHERCWTGW